MKNKFYKLKTKREVAGVIGIELKHLTHGLKRIDSHYEKFIIKKKCGGEREILAPSDEFKVHLGIISDILTEYDTSAYEKRKSLSHAYRKNKSIITNAMPHRRKKYVLNFDLENFFPTIHFGRICGFFMKNKDFLMEREAAAFLANLVCYKGILPQGSPCSPIISDLIARVLDVRIISILKGKGCSYTRYADDITISCYKDEFPSNIAWIDENGNWFLGVDIVRILEKSGFKVNRAKTRMSYSSFRQIVTGLVVNKKVNIPIEYYRRLRSLCYYHFMGKDFYIDDENKFNETHRLEGMLNYVYYVRNFSDDRDIKDKLAQPKGSHVLFQKFLYHKYFINNEKPILYMEGKTDVFHVKSAMKRLNIFYDSKDEKYLCDFFKHKDEKKRVLPYAYGTSGMKRFIQEIENRYSKYNLIGKCESPVILIVDGDKAGQNVYFLGIKEKHRETKNSIQWKHIKYNVYIIMLPNDKVIETLYADVLKVENDKVILEDGEFSKVRFFEESRSYDFSKLSKFKELLKIVDEIISDYQKK